MPVELEPVDDAGGGRVAGSGRSVSEKTVRLLIGVPLLALALAAIVGLTIGALVLVVP